MKFKLKVNDELDRALLWLAAFSLIAMLVSGFHSEFFFVLFAVFWVVRGANKRKRRIIYFLIPIIFVFATVFDPFVTGYSIETSIAINGWVMVGALIGIMFGLDFEVKKEWRYSYEP